jgi:hypothetical protein
MRMRWMLALAPLAGLGLACGENAPEDAPPSTDPGSLEERVTRGETELPVVPVRGHSDAGKLAIGTARARLVQVAVVAPPEVAGSPLEASSIAISGDFAFVSYHRAGVGYGGAVDVIDVSDPSHPVLASAWTASDEDVNAVAAGGGRVHLALSGENLGFEETAAVRSYEVSSGVLDTTRAKNRALSSYVANSVAFDGSHVWATTGDDGHLFRLDPESLAVTASVAIPDARSVASGDGQVVVHAKDRLRRFDSLTWTDLGSWTFARANDEGARSRVVVAGGKAFATAGSSGVHVLDLSAGTVLQTVAVPDPAAIGRRTEEVVANDVGLEGEHLFMAEGGAGLMLARAGRAPADLPADRLSPFSGLSSVVLDGASSANAVAVSENVLLVASGRGGLRVIRVEAIADFTDVSADVAFDVRTMKREHGLAGLAWADLDGDGWQDAVIAGKNSSVLMNQAGTSFVRRSLGDNQRAVSLLDLDDDGDVDFATSWNTSFFVNDGLGNFTRHRPSEVAIFSNQEGQVAYDYNRDGWADLFVFCQNGNWVATRRSTPTLQFSVASSGLGLNGSGSIVNGSYVASADVNDDGRLDLLYDRDGSSPRLFASSGRGSWSVYAPGPTDRPDDKTALAFGDIDGDDDLDLFVGGAGGPNGIRLWRNDAGVYVDVTAEAGLDAALGARAADFGDHDDDGDLDLAFTSTAAGSRVRLARNDGSGGFTRGYVGPRIAGTPASMSFVDHDNDGDLDLSIVVEGAGNRLLRNDVGASGALQVRVRGRGAGHVDRLALGTTVRLYASDGVTFVARRQVAPQKGSASGPLRVHFGGLDPDATYVVKAELHTGTVTSTVVPSAVTSRVGGTDVPRLLIIDEP